MKLTQMSVSVREIERERERDCTKFSQSINLDNENIKHKKQKMTIKD